jgi:flavodoxin
MKTAVIYSSRTGNTRKVAEAILEGAGEDARIFSAEEPVNIAEFDLIFMGFWVDKGMPDSAALKAMERISGRKVALFATLGAYPDSQHAKDSLEKGSAALGDNCTVLDTFICQGAVDPKLIEWMKTLPPDHPHAPNRERVQRWKDASTRPDGKDLENARKFAENVVGSIQ